MRTLNPSYLELKALDGHSLLDTLIVHTELYRTVLILEGASVISASYKKTILLIHRLIDQRSWVPLSK
jgi:hypothetical protein